MRVRIIAGWGALALVAASLAPSGVSAQTDDAAARRAFLEAAPVFAHPRCINCHHRGDGPRQGDAQRVHLLNVKRGPEGRGEAARPCVSCHKAQNTAGGAVPGAPDWRMPPAGRAGWDGFSPAEICAAIKDPARNAGLTPAQVVAHLEQDALVAWSWQPGGARTRPPISRETFLGAMRAWSEKGAACPD